MAFLPVVVAMIAGRIDRRAPESRRLGDAADVED
jgi:hypothetical protein